MIRYKFTWILALTSLCLIFAACSTADVSKNYEYSISIDTFQIDEEINHYYLNFSTICEENDTIFMCFQPQRSNFMYTYILRDNKPIFFQRDLLPNSYLDEGIGFISSAVRINKDSMLFFQDNRISIYNLEQKEIVFEYYHSSDTGSIFLIVRDQPIIYDNASHSVFMYIIRYDDKSYRESNSDSECIGKLDITDSSFVILPIQYSKDYNSDRIHLPYLDPFFAVNDTYIVTGYGISPDVYIYDRKSNTGEFKTLLHPYYSEIRGISCDSARDKAFLIQLLTREPRYLRLIYDPYNKLYYRFYELPLKGERNDEGLLLTYIDKKMAVNIINEKFEIIGDVILDKVDKFPKWTPTSIGLVQMVSKSKTYKLCILKIGENE